MMLLSAAVVTCPRWSVMIDGAMVAMPEVRMGVLLVILAAIVVVLVLG